MNKGFETGKTAQELEYCMALGKLQFSSEAKARMAMRLKSSAKPRKKSSWTRRTVTAALAAVLVVALGIGAGAAGAFQPVTELFAPLFGTEESQLELIERMGTPLDISDTVDGVTVTAKAMLNDGRSLAVLYSASRDDGTPLIPADAPEDGQLLFTSQGGSGPWAFENRSGYAYGATPGAESAEYLQYYTVKSDGETEMSVDLGCLEYWYGGPANTERIFLTVSQDDFWGFDLPVSGTNCPVLELSGGYEECVEHEIPFAVTSVRVSPLSVKVVFEPLEAIRADSLTEAEIRVLCDNQSLILRKKDDTELDLSSYDDGHGNLHPTVTWDSDESTGTASWVCGTVFAEIVPLEEMDCVIFHGMEYPVDP